MTLMLISGTGKYADGWTENLEKFADELTKA